MNRMLNFSDDENTDAESVAFSRQVSRAGDEDDDNDEDDHDGERKLSKDVTRGGQR